MVLLQDVLGKLGCLRADVGLGLFYDLAVDDLIGVEEAGQIDEDEQQRHQRNGRVESQGSRHRARAVAAEIAGRAPKETNGRENPAAFQK